MSNKLRVSNPTSLFTVLEPHDQEIGFLRLQSCEKGRSGDQAIYDYMLHRIRRPPGFEIPK